MVGVGIDGGGLFNDVIPVQGVVTEADIKDLLDEVPDAANLMQSAMEVTQGLWDVLCQLQQGKDDADQFWPGFLCLTEIIIKALVQLPDTAFIKKAAQMLRDCPDHYPMFASAGPYVQPSDQQRKRYWKALCEFLDEMREQDHFEGVVFGGILNVFVEVGCQAIGGLRLADMLDELADPERLKQLSQQMPDAEERGSEEAAKWGRGRGVVFSAAPRLAPEPTPEKRERGGNE